MFFVHLAEVFSRLRRIGLGEHILKESLCQKKGLEPHYLGMSQNSDARKCLFLTKKNRFRASLFWDIPICETSIQRVVFYLKNFPWNGVFKINGCSKPFFRSFFWPSCFLNHRAKKKGVWKPNYFRNPHSRESSLFVGYRIPFQKQASAQTKWQAYHCVQRTCTCILWFLHFSFCC